MGFSRKRYWSGLPFSSPEDLPDAGIEPRSPILQADASPSLPGFTRLYHALPGKPKVGKSHSSLTVKEQGLQNQTELAQIPVLFVTSGKWTQLSRPSFLHVKNGLPAAGTSHNAAPHRKEKQIDGSQPPFSGPDHHLWTFSMWENEPLCFNLQFVSSF